MRWLADECVAAPLIAFLRAEGHDVLYVAEVDAGLSDVDVIALAVSETRPKTRILAILSFAGNTRSPGLC